MYSRTDKIRHFNELRKPSAARKDFELLKKNNPSLSRLARYERNPERYADDILYDLLDCCTAEDIKANRGNSTDDHLWTVLKARMQKKSSPKGRGIPLHRLGKPYGCRRADGHHHLQ